MPAALVAANDLSLGVPKVRRVFPEQPNRRTAKMLYAVGLFVVLFFCGMLATFLFLRLSK
jgi:hypothetical protein